MKWLVVDEMSAGVPLPEGYRYQLFTRPDIPSLVAASCYLRERFRLSPIG